jgi:NitT/TauT family transport system substrate-binding protein
MFGSIACPELVQWFKVRDPSVSSWAWLRRKKQMISVTNRFVAAVLLLITGLGPTAASAQGLTKVAFPYGPLGLNSLPWVVAKEARLFEKHGLDVDMIYVGASAVIVQSMLSGSAGIAGFGGPAVITNVLRGGDIIQVAAMAPYYTQSLIARPDLHDLRRLEGKKIGITRFGSVTDFAMKTIIERHKLKDVHVLQMGGFPETGAGLARGAIDAALFSPPHNFRLVKEGFRELVSPKDLRAFGAAFSPRGSSRGNRSAPPIAMSSCA